MYILSEVKVQRCKFSARRRRPIQIPQIVLISTRARKDTNKNSFALRFAPISAVAQEIPFSTESIVSENSRGAIVCPCWTVLVHDVNSWKINCQRQSASWRLPCTLSSLSYNMKNSLSSARVYVPGIREQAESVLKTKTISRQFQRSFKFGSQIQFCPMIVSSLDFPNNNTRRFTSYLHQCPRKPLAGAELSTN